MNPIKRICELWKPILEFFARKLLTQECNILYIFGIKCAEWIEPTAQCRVLLLAYLTATEAHLYILHIIIIHVVLYFRDFYYAMLNLVCCFVLLFNIIIVFFFRIYSKKQSFYFIMK